MMHESYCNICEHRDTYKGCSVCLPSNYKFDEKLEDVLGDRILGFMEDEGGNDISESLIVDQFRNYAIPLTILKILGKLTNDIKIFILSKEIHYSVY